MGTIVNNPTAAKPVSTQEMLSRAAIAQNMNREKADKLDHPGALKAVWDTVTFKSKQRGKDAEALRNANELIKKMMDSIESAFAKMNH